MTPTRTTTTAAKSASTTRRQRSRPARPARVQATEAKVTLRATSPATTRADVLVIGVQADGDDRVVAPGAEAVVAAMPGLLPMLTAMHAATGAGDVTALAPAGAVAAPLLLVAGLGDAEEIGDEFLRRAAGAALRSAGRAKTVALALPVDTDDRLRAVVEGALLGSYVYDAYLEQPAETPRELVVHTSRARSRAATDCAAAARTTASAVNFARDLVNAPPNDLYPQSFADLVRARARATAGAVTLSVLDDKALAAQGYGGLVGVGCGSQRGPRLVTLQYRPRGAKTHLALVGKGITFDSGGLSIKTGAGMMTMKCDMAGAAAISAAVLAIAELGLPIQVTGYACLAENMPSGSATRPGDVLRMFGGKTVEVLNTDAEGRLVLADGITTAAGQKPDLIVDVATLTGACVIALGRNTAGVFSNDDDLHREIPQVARRAGEQMWAMPISEEMRAKVRTTKIAQLSQHNTEPWGGAMFAAAFLREFVPEGTPWAHLDIAGPAFNDGAPAGYTPRGGTGAAVRTLVQLAKERSQA